MSEQLEINAFHSGFAAAPKPLKNIKPLLIHSPHILLVWAGKAMTYSIS
jgi:hypothetical protein